MWFDLFSITLLVFIAITAIIMAYNIISGSNEQEVDLFARFRMHTAGMDYFGSSLFIAVAFSFFPETFLIGLLMIVYFGETDQVISWQIDHLKCWRTSTANAVEALTKVVI